MDIGMTYLRFFANGYARPLPGQRQVEIALTTARDSSSGVSRPPVRADHISSRRRLAPKSTVESDGIDGKFDYVKIRNEAENLPECPPQRDRPLSDPKASA
jgi:hypothetical protein